MSSTISDLLRQAHEPRWLDYLFYGYGRAELGAWARRLHYFRFVKALGGHANDGDRLLAALHYADNADLRSLLAQFGLPAGPGNDADPIPSPGCVTLAGVKVYVDVRSVPNLQLQQLELSIIDPKGSYDITPQAVVAAEAVEQLLVAHALRIIDPPGRDHHCVCPAYYPELWADENPRPDRRSKRR